MQKVDFIICDKSSDNSTNYPVKVSAKEKTDSQHKM